MPATAWISASWAATPSNFFFNSLICSSESGAGKKSFLVTFNFFSCFFFFNFWVTSASGSTGSEALSLSAAASSAAAASSEAALAGSAASSIVELASSGASSFVSSFAAPLVLLAFSAAEPVALPVVLVSLGFGFVTFTQYASSTVAIGVLNSMRPLNSRGTVTEIFGLPVILYSFHLPSKISCNPVTVYSETGVPSSKMRTRKSSSSSKASFFLPPRGVPFG
mmetsp:Transcript_80946/g.203666  ORF Transcript_80946/g.203666 Transcript_80946/m.203666 type:complete len:223 (+) Transcript_80946:852-1520(+)